MDKDITQSPVFQQLLKEWSGQSFDVKRLAAEGYARIFGTRADANESIMFARELEHVFAKTYDILYPGLKARSLVPVSREVPTGADSFTYQQYDRVGEAKEIDDYAKDFPTVEVKGNEFSNKVIALGASYQYSVQDMRAAAMAKKPLDAMKASAVRLAMEEKLEKIAATGSVSSTRAPKGLLNAPSVADIPTLPNGQWDNLVNTDTVSIQQDVAFMKNYIWTTSKTVHGNSNLTLLCDTTTFALLQSRPQSPTFKDSSIAEFLLRTVPGLAAIDYWLACDTSDGGSRQLCMYEKDPDLLTLEIPQEFEQLPPQLEGMASKIYCHMRVGGVVVRRPLSMVYTNDHIG